MNLSICLKNYLSVQNTKSTPIQFKCLQIELKGMKVIVRCQRPLGAWQCWVSLVPTFRTLKSDIGAGLVLSGTANLSAQEFLRFLINISDPVHL